MSTTVELLAANERYERLRAAVEELARFWVTDEDEGVAHVVACQDFVCRECVVIACASDLRAQLESALFGGAA